MNRFKALALAAALSGSLLGATVAAPSASANPSTPNARAGNTYAGSLWENYGGPGSGGSSAGLFYTNVGACDSQGYYFDLTSMSLIGWHSKVSAVSASNYNGCTSVKITRYSDGATFTCYSVCMANTGNVIHLGAGWSDNIRFVRYFKG